MLWHRLLQYSPTTQREASSRQHSRSGGGPRQQPWTALSSTWHHPTTTAADNDCFVLAWPCCWSGYCLLSFGHWLCWKQGWSASFIGVGPFNTCFHDLKQRFSAKTATAAATAIVSMPAPGILCKWQTLIGLSYNMVSLTKLCVVCLWHTRVPSVTACRAWYRALAVGHYERMDQIKSNQKYLYYALYITICFGTSALYM